MKYLCLNVDHCGYFKYVKIEELTKRDYTNPFKNCENCKYLMVLVKDDFSFNSSPNLDLLHKIISKSD
jgi:hypothetical protein